MHEKEKGPLFPQPDDFNICAWRYLDLAKAIVFLQSRELYFRRADLFPDAFEGSITKPLAEAWAKIALRAKIPEVEQLMSIARRCARKTVYVNCWHLNDSESEAMWQLYCPNSHGIAVQTNYAKLAKWSMELPNCFIGKVKYINYQKEKFGGNYLNAFMHKRSSFAHESEVRIIISDHEKFGEAKTFEEIKKRETELNNLPSGKSFKFPFEIIDRILVNPYSPDWYFKMFQDLVSQLVPALSDKIQRSEIKDIPFY